MSYSQSIPLHFAQDRRPLLVTPIASTVNYTSAPSSRSPSAESNPLLPAKYALLPRDVYATNVPQDVCDSGAAMTARPGVDPQKSREWKPPRDGHDLRPSPKQRNYYEEEDAVFRDSKVVSSTMYKQHVSLDSTPGPAHCVSPSPTSNRPQNSSEKSGSPHAHSNTARSSPITQSRNQSPLVFLEQPGFQNRKISQEKTPSTELTATALTSRPCQGLRILIFLVALLALCCTVAANFLPQYRRRLQGHNYADKIYIRFIDMIADNPGSTFVTLQRQRTFSIPSSGCSRTHWILFVSSNVLVYASAVFAYFTTLLCFAHILYDGSRMGLPCGVMLISVMSLLAELGTGFCMVFVYLSAGCAESYKSQDYSIGLGFVFLCLAAVLHLVVGSAVMFSFK